MNKNIVKLLLSFSEKGEKLMSFSKKIYKIYDEVTMDIIDIGKILEMVDEQKIEIGKTFIVEGIISNMAPINEPETYMDRSCRFTNGENGKTIMKVEAYPLPVSKAIGDDEKSIAFLYGRNTERAFEFNCDYSNNEIIIKEENKFIPVMINSELLENIKNKKVKMKVKIKKINSDEASKMYSYKNDIFKELIGFCYDPYNIDVNAILLEVEEIINIKENKVDLGKHAFGIEYKISKTECENIERELGKACECVRFKPLNLKGLGIGKINIIPCEKDIYINIKDNYIGFYIKIDANNRILYREKLSELGYVVKKVLTQLKKIGQVEISFISDENKRLEFE